MIQNLLISIAVLTFLAACATQGGVPEEELTLEAVLKEGRTGSIEEAQAHYANGRYEAAASKLSGILQNDPDNAEAALLMGESLLKLGRPKQSVGYFSAAKDGADTRAAALQGMGIAFLLLEDPASARPRLEEAVALDPELWRAYNALGQLHDSEQNWAAASEAYKNALAANPDAATVHNNLGMSAMLQREFGTAVAEFEKAVNLKPDLPGAQTNLRVALALNGDYVDAFAGVPRDRVADTLNNIGYAAMMRGDLEVAESYFVRAMEESPTFHKTAAANLDQLRYLRERRRSVAAES